jgi:hypothetical protein
MLCDGFGKGNKGVLKLNNCFRYFRDIGGSHPINNIFGWMMSDANNILLAYIYTTGCKTSAIVLCQVVDLP